MKPLDHISRPWTLVLIVLAAAALGVLLYRWLTDPGADGPASPEPSAAAEPAESSVPRYQAEYPAIGYSTIPPSDPIARLQRRLAAGEAELAFVPGRGYLDALLEALDIDPASQSLVFSRTSLQSSYISRETPRAIYFNDRTYVAFVPGAPVLEIASMDPRLGAVFYVLEQAPAAPAAFDRQFGRCLRCHDSLSLSGGGVPRFLLTSAYVDTRGRLVSHEGSIITSFRTPLRSRWGGWYVTGRHGSQVHLGNFAVRDATQLVHLETLRTSNLLDLEGLVDTQAYPVGTSDIVALMVMQHQVDVHNAIVRTSYKTRTALAEADAASADEVLERETEALVEALLFAGEVELSDPISGTSGFAARFEQRGPRDRRGRSLRELDLETRLFEYPLSYQIYSESFAALPDVVEEAVYARLAAILRGEDRSSAFAHLSDDDRAAVLEILRDTSPAFAAALQDEAGAHALETPASP